MKYKKLMLFNHALCGGSLAWFFYRKKKIPFSQWVSCATILLADIVIISAVISMRCEKRRFSKEIQHKQGE